MDLFRYRTDDGQEPFSEWLSGLADRPAQARIRARLRQLEAGNLGDCSGVGNGVLELRIHVGAGRHGAAIIILLAGGSKKTQSADIGLAKKYWLDWKGRLP